MLHDGPALGAHFGQPIKGSLGIAERYLDREQAFRLGLRLWPGDSALSPCDLIAIYERAPRVDLATAKDDILDSFDAKGLRIMGPDRDDASEWKSVLVLVGEIGQNAECGPLRPVASFVRLYFPNGIDRSRADAIDPAQPGIFAGLAGVDGELRSFRRCPAAGRDQLAGEVVHGAAQVVEHVAEDHAQEERRLLTDRYAQAVAAGVQVELAGHSMGFSIKEGANLAHKGFTMSVGAVQLGVDAV